LVSSVSGSGTGDLLDEVVKLLPEISEADDDDGIPKYAIVGRPNAGKSTLLNALLEEERSIVTDIPGTTRDTLSAEYKKYGKHFMLMDTAGLRKKAKVHENVEFYSVLRSLKAIETADVCLLLVDATLGFQAQDVNIFQVAQRRRKGIVIMVNKWDVVEKDHKSTKELTEAIQEKIAPFTDVPIVFISALEKQRIFKALDVAEVVYNNRIKKISTSKLNEILLPYIQATPPPSVRARYIRIKYITQLKASTPTFAFFCNHPKDVKENYQRFLENKLRQHFDFSGVPINLFFRQK
jgi:GTP-binding protein